MSTAALPAAKESRATHKITPLHARVMIAGMPGAGKSTLAAQWAPETTLLIDTQRGTTMLEGEHYVQHVRDWDGFVDTVDALIAGGHEFETVVIDMIDDVWRFADAAHAGRGRAFATATDDYNKAAKQAEGVFVHTIGRLTQTGLGIWFTSHVTEHQDGDMVRYRSKLDKRVLTYVQGICQFVLLAETLGPRRLLHTQPSARFEAKTRVPLPEPMDLDARALYAAMNAGLNPKAPKKGAKKDEPVADAPAETESADAEKEPVTA